MLYLRDFNDLLKKIRFSDIEIKSLVSLKNRIEDRALSINSNISEKVAGNKQLDKTCDLIVNYVDLDSEIKVKITELERDKCRAFKAIQQLSNPLERIVLVERHLNIKSWKEIAVDLLKSERQLLNIYKSAMSNMNTEYISMC